MLLNIKTNRLFGILELDKMIQKFLIDLILKKKLGKKAIKIDYNFKKKIDSIWQKQLKKQ